MEARARRGSFTAPPFPPPPPPCPQVTTLCCIEDGALLPATRVSLPYGGQHLALALQWVLQVREGGGGQADRGLPRWVTDDW